MKVINPDNRPSLEDYLDAHSTVFVMVSMRHPTYARSFIVDLEIMNRPPAFEFGPGHSDQVCFMGNINGGDSLVFYNRKGLLYVLDEKYQDWLDDNELGLAR